MTDAIAYPGTELEALAEAENYYGWVLEQFGPFLGENVVEVGAGLGTFAQRLLDGAAPRHLTLFEPDAGLAASLQARFADRPQVSVFPTVFAAGPITGPVDSIVLVNVLEHIEQDAAFAREAFDALRPGGAMAIFVPAMPALYGSLDRAFDHYRRYTRGSLRELLTESGFEVRRLRYMNLPGVASWFIAGRILRMRTIRPASMRAYDKLVIPWVSWLERRLEPPIGQNLLAIAVRPAGPDPPSSGGAANSPKRRQA